MSTQDDKAQPPQDLTPDERKYFEMTGSLEMYELRKKADAQARERVQLIQEEVERQRMESDMRIAREQVAQHEADLAAMRARRSLPGNNPWAEPPKPLANSERLHESVKACLRRLFMTVPEWTPDNQQGLVNLLLEMGDARACAWANELLQGLASDSYGTLELTPQALLKGSTGLKQLAGSQLMQGMRALGGGQAQDTRRTLGGSSGGRKKGRAKKRTDERVERVGPVDAIVEPKSKRNNQAPVDDDDSATNYEYVDGSDDTTYDESPMNWDGLDSTGSY
jgi:hypothetical protein